MPDSISVVYCYPRSGGTLLNQCLLCSTSNVVLSEVNPTASVIDPEKQAADWFGLITSAEAANLRSRLYLDKISFISKMALREKKAFCLRDWSGINFLDKISAWHGAPSMQLEQRIYLERAGYRLREIALLRRSQAVYESMHQNIPELHALTPEVFEFSYRAYLQQIEPAKKYYLEKMAVDGQRVLKNICADLELQYSSDFEIRFHNIKTVTGNNTLPKPPPSAKWTSIQPQTSNQLTTNPFPYSTMFKELDQLAGYESSSP